MEEKTQRKDVQHDKGLTSQTGIVVRKFEPADEAEVQRIFCEGIMGMVTDTAFTGLRYHPESLLLYTTMTVVCFAITRCWWVIGLVPAIVLCARYFYSRRVIRGFQDLAMTTDMADIEGFYMKSPDKCFWVAVQDAKVVGHIAAVCHQKSESAVELLHLSVDKNYRRCGAGVALCLKVLEFAATNGYSSVIVGTTNYKAPAHRLYQRMGFRWVGATNGFATPGGVTGALLEKMFYRVRHHHYAYVKN